MSPLKSVKLVQKGIVVVCLLYGDSPSLVWTERMLKLPSFGCVLHLPLCLCKTCNIAHHDSTEMSQDQDEPYQTDARRGGIDQVCRSRTVGVGLFRMYNIKV